MLTILIVDDSKTECLMLKEILESSGDMRVIGFAKNGKEAVELTASLHPNIITMDIKMPIMDGVEAINLIMTQCPTPIVVISSAVNNNEMQTTFNALQAGALTVLGKPINISSPVFATSKKHMIDTIRSMAEIKVIKRRFFSKKSEPKPPPKSLPCHSTNKNLGYEIIAIGASVGGPQALTKILSKLPSDFPLPIVIVQHMTLGFINGFADWLNKNIKLQVKIAEKDEVLKAGTIYFAPDSHHLEIERSNSHLTASLINSTPVSGFKPSVTVLLKSVAHICGQHAVGVLLTGMGSDGAEGLLDLKKMRGHTLIQDPESTIVFGMAGVAQALGAVDQIVELDAIADYLIKISNNQKY